VIVPLAVDQLPRATSALLREGAETAITAAVTLHRLVAIDDRDEARQRLTRELEVIEDHGDRITHELIHDLESAHAIGHARGAVLGLAQAIDEATDCLYDLAQLDPSPVPRPVRLDVTAILRDIARANVAALRDLSHETDDVQRLAEEGRHLLRRAHAAALSDSEPLDALRRMRWLTGARAALEAGADIPQRLHVLTFAL
jgi:hypothetical protein